MVFVMLFAGVRRCTGMLVGFAVNIVVPFHCKCLSLYYGKPYENTEECWGLLNLASKAARYLQLVNPAAFNDRRNPDPVVYASHRETAPEVRVSGRIWQSDVNLPDFPD